MRVGAKVNHKDYGKGVIKLTCKDKDYVQVQFDAEPPKPGDYPFSSNPFVVHIENLRVIKDGKGTYMV